MNVVVSCPFVHWPSFEAMWATLHPTLRDHALVIDNTATNLGAAGSRNRAIAEARARDAGWIMEVSPATRFGPSAGLDFRAAIDAHPDAWVIQSATPINWHCIAWSLALHDRVGLWDENYWPINGEDGDLSRRVHLAAAEDERVGTWECVPVDGWITMYGHSAVLAGIRCPQEPLWAYYAEKWGGRSGGETYARPFNRDDVGLGWWPAPPDPRSIIGART